MTSTEEKELDSYTVIMQVAQEFLPELKRAYPDKSDKELINLVMREGLCIHKDILVTEIKKTENKKKNLDNVPL